MLLAASVRAAESESPRKIGTVEGLTEYVLDNGLKVVLFPEPSQPKVTVNMTVLVGSRHEGYGEAGMAHLLEHMLFKPTEKHPHADRDLQERGASYNGTTWTDRTNYYETLPATDENLEYAIGLEADRLVNCPIRAEDLASEMTVVRNEFEMGENNPKAILEQRMTATAYEWHNYGKSTIGNRADIERVPVDKLRAFYKKYYRPDNVVLFISGRFDEAKALALVQQHFGPLKNPSEPIPTTYTEEPAQDGERNVVLRRVGNVPVVGLMYHIPAASDPEYAAVDVLNGVLAADKTGRLYKALVERQRAASVDGVAYPMHDPSLMRFMAEVNAGNEPSAVLAAMVDVVQSTTKQPVTDEEVERVKRTLLKQWDQRFNNTAQFTIDLTEGAAAGDWRLLFLYRDRLEQVTTADVNRVAEKYLRTSNQTQGIFVPTAEPERTSVPAAPDLASLLKDYRGRSDQSQAEVFDPSPSAIEKRVVRSSLEGIKTAFLPKKTRGNTVILQLRLRYGSADSLFGLANACELLPELMTRGTSTLNAQQIQDRLDQLETSLAAMGVPGVMRVTLQTKREHLPEVIDLLRQILRDPSLPQAEFDILQKQLISQLEENAAQPNALAPRVVNQTLNPYPAGDVRHVPTMEEELKLVQTMKLDDVRRVYREFLSSQAGELVLVGDFDEAEITPALQQMLADWKSPHAYQRIAMTATGPETGSTVRIATPDKANAMYYASMIVPLNDLSPDYPALLVANEILGGSGFASRLMSRIREKEGLSYGVGSGFRADSIDPRASLTLYAIANPQNIEKVMQLAHEEVNRLVADPVTDEELQQAQQGWIQSELAQRANDMALSTMLASSLYVNRTLEFQQQLENAVAQVTKSEIQQVLAKYVRAEKLVNAIAGDLK